jgi:acyl carrier protein
VSIEREFDITLEIPDIIRMNSIGEIIEVLVDKGVDLGA